MPGGRMVFVGVLRRHRVAVASWAALSVMAASLVAYAVSSQGFPAHKADLNDGGVWVTRAQSGGIARQNVPISQMDALTWAGPPNTPSSTLDVLQNGSAVVSYNGSSVMPIDVTAGAADDKRATAVAGVPALGGSVLSVVDPRKGTIWATSVDPVAGVASVTGVGPDSRPLATVGPGALGTVSENGTVLAASADRARLVTIRSTDGRFEAPDVSALPKRPDGGIAQIAAVGDTPAILDKSGHVLLGDHRVDVGTVAALQQTGPASDQVLVATSGALLAVDPGSGTQRTVAKAPATGEQPERPVRLGDCDWSVWSTSGSAHVVTACDGAEPVAAVVPGVGPAPQMEFRVNRNQIVLNDTADGSVWKIVGTHWERIDQWRSLQEQPDTKTSADPDPRDASRETPPLAKDDDLGVRPGRTTVLHVLDNDRAATRAILAITKLDGHTLPAGVTVQVAPDQQSVLANVLSTVPAGTYSFGYTIDDGSGTKKTSDDGTVTLRVKTDPGSGTPRLREGFTLTQYYVATGGTIEIPASPDWRDTEYGDPIAIREPKADVGTVSVTPQGLLKFEAPPELKQRQTVTVGYTATTGGDTTPGSVRVTVLPKGIETQAAQAEPDAAAGQVGGTIVVHPLDNDIPGADPGNLDARLTLAGDVAPVRGQAVETDPVAGTVTMRPTQAGSYLLSYSVAFGNAKTAPSQIRVMVSPPKGDATVPVPGPDTATVRGQSPTTVDVLANDYDPRGGMLVVTSAEPTSPDSRLSVAVIDGRWLRVSADDPAMVPAVQAIQYTVTNGSAEAPGSLTVTQDQPLDPEDNSPVPGPDKATVRAGSEVVVPVLDNDSTPSGDPVALDQGSHDDGPPPGGYVVLGDPNRDLGKAYMAGRNVRYVAPTDDGKGPLDVRIEYVVINAGEPLAAPASGQLSIHVTPLPTADAGNRPPTPRALEARVVQGDTVTLQLAPTGLDPDGDPVNIVSVGDVDHGAPRLGRVTAVSGGAITYQAFPGVSGTDQFSYAVEDTFGARAIGVARVAVVQPGPPQPPVALDDLVTADVGREVVVDVLANDLRTPGTRLTLVVPETLPPGVTKMEENGLVTVTTNTDDEGPVPVTYTATNGIDQDTATLRVLTQEGFDNPPQADDVLATPDAGSESVTVDVLAHVFDIDDSSSDLQLGEIPGVSQTDHGKLEIPVKPTEQVIPYEVTDSRGAVGAAVVRIPAPPADTPYLKPGAEIKVAPNKSVTTSLDELVVDPEGDPVVLTTLDPKALYGAPAGALDVSAKGTSLRIDAGDNPGPASVTFTVSDRPDLADTKAHVITLTVPVQIGDDKPVITCPTEPLDVQEGGRDLLIDVASVCHVWTDPPSAARTLKFQGSWSKDVPGVSLTNTDGRLLLHTGAGARAGTRGEIAIGVTGQPASARLYVRVTKLPPPTLGTINVDGHAGKPTVIDFRKYLDTKVSPDAIKVQVVSVTPLRGATATATPKGSVLTVTPRPNTHGLMRFRVEVSDLGKDSTRPRAIGEVRVAVAAPPSAPTGLIAGQDMLSKTVALSWRAPSANGARITSYVVKYSSSKKKGTHTCSASPCRVTDLVNGVPYTFQVQAVNAEGAGGWSNTATAQPDDVTGPVLGLSVKLQRDHHVTLSWNSPAKGEFSPAKTYRVTWPGDGRDVTTTTIDAQVPANGQEYTFTVVPINDKGEGTPATVTGMGAGAPDAPEKPTFALQDRPDNRKAVQVNWGAVDPNGPNPVEYQVFRDGTTEICHWVTATTCADDLPKDGATYTYTVKARNAEESAPREASTPGHHVSEFSPAGTVESASPPDAMAISDFHATGTNQEVQVSFTSGASHGKTNQVQCTVNGNACPGSPWTYPVTGASDTKRFTTSVPNGTTATIQVRACNGSSGSSQVGGTACSAWVSKQTTPYGPIGTPSINVSPSGDHIVGSASWNANGKPVNVRITRNGTTIYSANGVGSGSKAIDEAIGYSKTGTYVITVSDAGLVAGQTTLRATKTASDSATTPAPPQSVTVSKGPSCAQSACSDGGLGYVPCSNLNNCWHIQTTTANFPGSVTCHIEENSGGSTGVSWNQAGNATTLSGGNWEGGTYTWRAVCNGVPSDWTNW